MMERIGIFKVLYLLLFVFSLCLKPTSLSNSGEVLCIEREKRALLEFKQGLIDNGGVLSSWGSEGDKSECCKWSGVACNNITGHIIHLDLHCDRYSISISFPLRGKINPALLELQHLNYLDLSGNDFGFSQIPKFFGSFKKLRHLKLGYSNFSGDVPYELGNLTNLQTLKLAESRRSLRVKNLEWLSHLSLLSYLHLTGVDLYETNWQQQITKLPFLKELRLLGCPLSNTLPAKDIFANSSLPSLNILEISMSGLTSNSIFPWLFNFTKSAISIDLSYNQLDGPIPDAFGELKSAISIDLSKNQLDGPIPDAFGELKSAKSIDLSNNQLDSHIPDAFGELKSAISIDLSHNQLDGPIPDAFEELIFLEELRLNDNKLHGGIPKSMGNVSHLILLDLHTNNLNESITELFHNLSGKVEMSLEHLDLCGNQIFGALPDLTKFSCLWILTLCWNQLNGFLPQSLRQPSSLAVLDLSYNHISGSLPGLKVHSSLTDLYLTRNQLKRLPECIWQLPKLEIFLAASNLLEGTITEAQLSNLANLKGLDLSFNNLTLNLSSDWVPPFRLNDIYLSHCNMGPHFPKWLQTQNSLFNLDISVAGISDAVPDWFWNMSFGIYINISHNQMRGEIPEVSKDLSKDVFPTIADFSHNNFSGPIPLFVFQSYILRISKNMLSGSISFVCKIPIYFTYFLDFSDNELSGTLPNCWNSLPSLIVLNLANNHFRGKIPNTIGALYQLQTLHLRNNNIMGKLPSSLKNCRDLRMIDLGENKLTGDIPAWMGTHLTRLAVLSLRSNQFHGKISPTICQLVNIQILDLSINHISGKIPRCLNNFTSLVEKNSSIETMTIDPSYFERYVDNVLVQWKGKAIEYEKLGLLKGIDLSSNMLVGTIPQELSDLRGLIFLNLSRNHLTGNIISSIGQMEMLEWLDLSKNQLSGEIPTGLANLNYLSILDLSYNNLTGKIPLGTQLQSFNASAYGGNNELCGHPLAECPRDAPDRSLTDHGKGNNVEEDDGFITREFYFCMVFGFIFGFWTIIGTLFLKHSWRHAYFNFFNNVGNWMYVTTTVYVTRFTRKLRG